MQSKPPAGRAPGLPRLVRVLVVDDNQDMVTTLTALLRADGFETHGAFNGGEALHVLEKVKPCANRDASGRSR